MAGTKSKSRSKGKDAPHDEAHVSVNKKASVATTTTKDKSNMADNNNGMPSVIEFEEDIGQAEAPVPLPVGDYTAEIRAAAQKTSAAGNTYGSVQFFIPADQYPADFTEGEPEGMLLTYNRVSLSDTPAGRHRLRKFVEAIGAPAGKKIDLNDWVGRTATVTVQHDTYEGETRAAIGKVTAS